MRWTTSQGSLNNMSSRGSREVFYSLKIIVSLQPRKIASEALITEKSTQTIHFNVLIHTIKCFFFFSLKSLLPIFKKEIRAFYSNKHLTKTFFIHFGPLFPVGVSRCVGSSRGGLWLRCPNSCDIAALQFICRWNQRVHAAGNLLQKIWLVSFH